MTVYEIFLIFLEKRNDLKTNKASINYPIRIRERTGATPFFCVYTQFSRVRGGDYLIFLCIDTVFSSCTSKCHLVQQEIEQIQDKDAIVVAIGEIAVGEDDSDGWFSEYDAFLFLISLPD